jgi:hypothetical protein
MAGFDLKQQFESMREQLEKDEAEGELAGLTVENLKDAMSHPRAPEMVARIMETEQHSVKEGEPAPDFTLPWLPGPNAGKGASLTLSDHFGRRPVALVFGSYT